MARVKNAAQVVVGAAMAVLLQMGFGLTSVLVAFRCGCSKLGGYLP